MGGGGGGGGGGGCMGGVNVGIHDHSVSMLCMLLIVRSLQLGPRSLSVYIEVREMCFKPL